MMSLNHCPLPIAAEPAPAVVVGGLTVAVDAPAVAWLGALGFGAPAAGRFTLGGTMRIAAAEVALHGAVPSCRFSSEPDSGLGAADLLGACPPPGPSRPASEYIARSLDTRWLGRGGSQ